MAIAADEFRNALQYWASGVTIVTAQCPSLGFLGMTASSFSSVSMDPPQILVCINKDVSTAEAINESGAFAINILTSQQEAISNLFANPSSYADRFSATMHEAGKTGAPLLTESLASIECTVVEQVSAVSHWIIIGAVQNTVIRPGEPLLYYKTGYRELNQC